MELGGIRKELRKCLDTTTFNVFSNTSSAAGSNHGRPPSAMEVSVEAPHNHIHLAVGGFDARSFMGGPAPHWGIVDGSNG